jgi:hypothetical protein
VGAGRARRLTRRFGDLDIAKEVAAEASAAASSVAGPTPSTRQTINS